MDVNAVLLHSSAPFLWLSRIFADSKRWRDWKITDPPSRTLLLPTPLSAVTLSSRSVTASVLWSHGARKAPNPSLTTLGLWYSFIPQTALRSLHFPCNFELCFLYRPLLVLPQFQPDFFFILSRSHTTCFGLCDPLLAQAHVCPSLVLYPVSSSSPAARCLLPDAVLHLLSPWLAISFRFLWDDVLCCSHLFPRNYLPYLLTLSPLFPPAFSPSP